jgi:hypothetical protein
MKAKRVDDNQKELVRRMRLIPNLTVAHIHTIGQGVPDLLVGYRGKNYLFEVKDPTKRPSARKLTEAEEKFHQQWTGTIHVVMTLDDVLDVLKIAV